MTEIKIMIPKGTGVGIKDFHLDPKKCLDNFVGSGKFMQCLKVAGRVLPDPRGPEGPGWVWRI